MLYCASDGLFDASCGLFVATVVVTGVDVASVVGGVAVVFCCSVCACRCGFEPNIFLKKLRIAANGPPPLAFGTAAGAGDGCLAGSVCELRGV